MKFLINYKLLYIICHHKVNRYNILLENKSTYIFLKGYEIVELLKTMIEQTYSKNPFGQIGGFMPRAIGVKAYILIENPKGHRVQKLFVEGEELNTEKSYSVSYITE
ncbi:5'-nucleotidase C-terminal domain-containing protein [Clostridium septicum]|nr:5'-nucleotidase C-terminal domain-containing protein [Clostridium septicum]MDU1313834.1 5'-nucleotidase C-terminal domain-containing protein [Clostridium septicum]